MIKAFFQRLADTYQTLSAKGDEMVLFDKKQITTILIGTLVVTALGYKLMEEREGRFRVDALGALTFTFNGLAPNAAVFDEPDVKPGDCYVREVQATNEGNNLAKIAVKATNVNDPDGLAEVMTILIADEYEDLYGEIGVDEFIRDSEDLLDGITLSPVPAQSTKIFAFLVCMPDSVGNEYQDKTMDFDLVFGTTPIENEIPVPPECSELAGQMVNVFHGTEAGESIHGTVENDLIYGYGGNDEIDGSGGNDCIIGGPGNDYLEGEDGNDIIVGNEGNDELILGSGNDKGYGNDGDDVIEGGSGDDLIYGGAGEDEIDAGTGNDEVYGEADDDVIDGKTGFDLIYGGGGDDVITGGSDDDRLYGEEGNDDLTGDSGNDYLNGGLGTDRLTGSTGADACVEGETIASCEGV